MGGWSELMKAQPRLQVYTWVPEQKGHGCVSDCALTYIYSGEERVYDVSKGGQKETNSSRI